MPLCPHCQGTAKPLRVLSFVSSTDFFQCEVCARLSERPKGSKGDLGPVHTPVAAAPRASL
jgi:hypothetical protein